jgi:hypothetical protein
LNNKRTLIICPVNPRVATAYAVVLLTDCETMIGKNVSPSEGKERRFAFIAGACNVFTNTLVRAYICIYNIFVNTVRINAMQSHLMSHVTPLMKPVYV